MARCLLALGSNLGDREENLSHAMGEVASLPDCQLLGRSRWHETTPIGGPCGQGEFLNGSLLVETRMPASDLAAALHQIERRLGRQHVVPWDARVIDIDLLLYDQICVQSPDLTIPHPRMSFRRFVLEPACEIAGPMIEPSSGWTLAQLLRHLDTSPCYVAVAAASSAAAQRLAKEIAAVLESPRLEEVFPGLGAADSASEKGIESIATRESSWRAVPELALRLSEESTSARSPVVCGTWDGSTSPHHVHPALVIAWDSPGDHECAAEFRERLNRSAHGPLARITAGEFPAVLAEALAAIRAVWPDLGKN